MEIFLHIIYKLYTSYIYTYITYIIQWPIYRLSLFFSILYFFCMRISQQRKDMCEFAVNMRAVDTQERRDHRKPRALNASTPAAAGLPAQQNT